MVVVPECFAFVLENLPITRDDTPEVKQRCLVKEWRREMHAILDALHPPAPKAA